jgi:hypothetical protein
LTISPAIQRTALCHQHDGLDVRAGRETLFRTDRQRAIRHGAPFVLRMEDVSWDTCQSG